MLHFHFAQLMALFETALHDTTKEWRLHRMGFLRAGEGSVSDDHLLEIHEAYQYLFVKFVDDVAKNTGKKIFIKMYIVCIYNYTLLSAWRKNYFEFLLNTGRLKCFVQELII